MSPREIFLNGCNEIAANFTDFKPTQKGQKLTKLASDKEILFEIYFGSSMRNYSGSVSILPQIAIYCKRLKKLMQEELSLLYRSCFRIAPGLSHAAQTVSRLAARRR